MHDSGGLHGRECRPKLIPMCGIAGVVSSETAPAQREAMVDSMCTAMAHRGPDDRGLTTRGPATLGSCRLAIFDPANGRQPMATPDGRWTLVFNGAIYNFKELRRELVARGHEFRTECDTEVLLASIAQWGREAVKRLRGMFAFAAWDAGEHTLLLARDPFGIKPLYYSQRGSMLAFASELNALVGSGSAARRIDPAAVADYLAWLAVPAPRTIYDGIVSLRPGECAVLERGKLALTRAWTFRNAPASEGSEDPKSFVGELRCRLTESIRAHTLADVPVGAFLSGGLDSTAVVALMTEALGRPLRTFCIGFEESPFSEAAQAEAAARHFGAVHQTEIVTGAEVARSLDTILSSLDQPTGDGINTYYASRAAKAGGVTVALSGLGGDELFGGYPSFRDTPRLARYLPWWRRLPPPVRRAVVGRLHAGDTRRRKLGDVLAHARDIQEVSALQRRVFSEKGRSSLLSADARATLLGRTPFHPELPELAGELEAADPFQVVSAWELRTYMADVLLRDSDVFSMRHSIELRVPFVDRELIQWLWPRASAGSRSPKQALFEAVADLLPPHLAHRKKRGFTLPLAVWMKRELRPFLEEAFSSASLARTGLFAPDRARALWDGFLARDDAREWSRVWSLAVLVTFANRSQPHQPPRSAAAVTLTEESSKSASLSGSTVLMAPEIYGSEGGIPRILQLYLRALNDSTVGAGEVRLVALNDSPDCGAQPLASFARVTQSVGCSRGKLRFVGASLRLARGADRIVCGHVRQLPIAWLARKANPRLKYYLVAHGIEVWRPFSALERKAIRGAARVLCVSEFTRQELLKNCPLTDGQAIVLHNTLDPFFQIEAGVPLAHCPPVILIVTRVTFADRYKGVQHMIEAMPAIRAVVPDATLRIVGRGDDVARLERLRDRLGMRPAVHFTGYLDDASLAAEMRACRLFALPSRKEGFGLVLLEAMAHGRPCLGARAGGIPEVVTPETGVLVEYGDVPAIAAAAVEGLRREWSEERILNRAREFAYPVFKDNLARILAT